MNKALHAFIYLFLILTGVALFFEYQLNEKRTEMKDRNRMQEDFIMDVARLTETGGDDEEATKELLVDSSPVEAKEVDSPEMVDILDDKGYGFYLEKLDHKFFTWGEAEREQLRQIYVLDAEGKPKLDGTDKQTRDSPEDKLLRQLRKAIDAQKDRLAKTREAITAVREQAEKVVAELNKLKPEARKDKVELVERAKKISDLEGIKANLENELTKKKAEIAERDTRIESLINDLSTAKEETESVKDDLEKANKTIEQLKKAIREIQNNNTPVSDTTKAITSVPIGDKGKIVQADNHYMFAIVELTPEAMRELKGDDAMRPLPPIEFSVKRAGFQGPAGEFVGRVRLRQEVSGKNYVVCEILSSWAQGEIEAGDVVFAD